VERRDKMLKQYVINNLFTHINYKTLITGIIFVLVIWNHLKFDYIFLLSLSIGLGHIALTYWQAKEDNEIVKGAIYRFGVLTTTAFVFTLFTIIFFGKANAVNVASFVYVFLGVEYLFSIWNTVQANGN
jgi:hypothetical protein